MLLRDLALIAATLAIWSWSRELDAGHAALAIPVAILAGIAAAYSGFLVHEWGHLLGALAASSAVELPSTVRSIFLFKFGSGNDRRQYLWMSVGGFIASTAVIAVLLAVLSFHALADWVAMALTAAGIIATFILELPPAWRVLRGGEVEPDQVRLPQSSAADGSR
ncbi:MAG TPA: hypothetical protein VN046_08455 [Stenotrophobium sp.]|jgi:hypothetical protein|nr:hypothetical protein [Stenotrophobium sp.]